MNAKLLLGKPVAEKIDAATRKASDAFFGRGIRPTLAVVRVGDDGAAASYERSIMKRADACGVDVESVVLAADAGTPELLARIDELNADPTVHGIMLFRPLPPAFDEQVACEAIAPHKDVDGCTSASLAGVFAGSGVGFAPATAAACVELADHYGVELAGKHVCVVGRSLVVGRPLAMLLLARDATVTLAHSKTKDAAALAREADIIVAAAGHAGLVDAGWLRPGQTVLDVGVNVGTDGKLCGDVDADAAQAADVAFTPVPGGIGAVTTSVLLSHVASAARAMRDAS